MSGKGSVIVFLALFVCGALAIPLAVAGAEDPPRMTTKELKERLGDPDLIVIDVRAGGSWSESASKIQGAVREDPDHVQNWVKKYPRDKTLVFYCSWANEHTSARVAREFKDAGYTKVYALKGGWKEWSKAGFPTEKK